MRDFRRNIKLCCSICENNKFEFSLKLPVVWKEIGQVFCDNGHSN